MLICAYVSNHEGIFNEYLALIFVLTSQSVLYSIDLITTLIIAVYFNKYICMRHPLFNRNDYTCSI